MKMKSWVGQRILRTRLASSRSEAIKPKDRAADAFFSIVGLVTFGLGVWQTQRLVWKIDLIKTQKASLQASPVDAPVGLSQQQLAEWSRDARSKHRVRIRGKFIGNEVRLGPRGAHIGVHGTNRTGMGSASSGYYIVAPFRTTDGNIVFVSRGWIPKDAKAWNCPNDEVTLTVVVSAPDTQGRFVPDTVPGAKTMTWMDPLGLIRETDVGFPVAVEDVVVVEHVADESKSDNNSELPIPRPVADLGQHSIMPEHHVAYAIMWFSLAFLSYRYRTKKIRYRRR